MANVWAIKSGDWSDPTVWNTGVLPTSADDVYANNFNVNVNKNVSVLSLRNTSNTGVTQGGTISFNTPDIVANIGNTLFFNSAPINFILVTAASGLITINITGSVQAPSSGNYNLIWHSGNCDLRLTATRFTAGTSSGSSVLINKTSTGLLTISADLYGGNGGGGNMPSALYLNSSSNTVVNGNVVGGNSNPILKLGSAIRAIVGNLTVNGNVTGCSSLNSGEGAIIWDSIGLLSIAGNVLGNLSPAITGINGNLNITGAITGGNVSGIPGVRIAGSAALNHIGTAQASSYASAIACDTPTTSSITCTGPFLKNNYIVAIASQTLRINFNSNSYFQFKKSNGEDIDYVSTIEGYNYPTASDVRDGVSYKSGLVTGTLKVPNPSDVRKSIPTDNTVGTADITPEDFIAALETSTKDIAKRLRNCATVESTGGQIAAYE